MGIMRRRAIQIIFIIAFLIIIGVEKRETVLGNVANDFEYEISGGEAIITGYQGGDKEITIPAKIDGYPVISIGNRAFCCENNEKSFLVKVSIEEGIKHIGSEAFYGCKTLKEIVFPKSIVNVQAYAFGLCVEIESIKLNGKMENINTSSFMGCLKLKEILLSQNSEFFYYDIGGVLFQKRTLLIYPRGKENKVYVVPKNIDTIYIDAFSNCKYLTEIHVTESVTTLCGDSFQMDQLQTPIKIYLHQNDNLVCEDGAFASLAPGSIIYVKNQNIADIVEKSLYDCEGTEVKILDDTTEIKATKLTFLDGDTDKSVQLTKDGTWQAEWKQEPEMTTDNVRWSSSEEQIASVDAKTGLIKASGQKHGSCVITGRDESGNVIVVHVTVDIPAENMTCTLNGNHGVQFDVIDQKEVHLQVSLEPANCNMTEGTVEWSSNNEKIGALKTDKQNPFVARLLCNRVGTVQIKARVTWKNQTKEQTLRVHIQKSMGSCEVSLPTDLAYTGKTIKPKMTIKDGDTTLKEKTDYVAAYKDNMNCGKATVSITGRGNYTGTIQRCFTIRACEDVEPEKVEKRSISTVKCKAIKSQVYNGKARKPALSVTYKGKKLKSGVDYKVSYSNNKQVGTATVKITGISSTCVKYTGSKKLTFKIIPAAVKKLKNSGYSATSITLTWKKNTGASGYQIERYQPAIKKWKCVKTISKNRNGITMNKLKSGTTYKFRIRALKKVKGVCYYGKYTESIRCVTNPGQVKIKKITVMGQRAKLQWNKVTGADGYVIYRSQKKDRGYGKIKSIARGKCSSYTDSKELTGKRYYYKIRAYKIVNGKKRYGKDSRAILRKLI